MTLYVISNNRMVITTVRWKRRQLLLSSTDNSGIRPADKAGFGEINISPLVP
jgi:hypothetical protein